LLFRRTLSARRACVLLIFLTLATLAASCGTISFSGQPALNYDFGSTQPLRIAIIDETGGTDWTPAIEAAVQTYGSATPHLEFQSKIDGANIVMYFRRYTDTQPPEIRGYSFPWGAGGFTTVYDEQGLACNFPPSPLPVNCDGEIAESDVYLNDIIPDGPDIEARRERLILHEMGHGMGLERHAPDLDIDQLASRYGWDGS
jgi:hypothetical protein